MTSPINNPYDYLIVGTGFTGSVLAERITSQLNKKVIVIDKRKHIGGNSYDYYNSSGVLTHKYGPHYFRTDSDKVFNYLSEFTEWRPYEYKVRACVNNKLYSLPINRDTLNKFFNINLKTEKEAQEFLNKKRVKIKKPKNSEEQVIFQVGWEIYEKFFKNYTIKQWGIAPKELDASVCARIPIRTNTDDRYFTDRIQAMPKEGYYKLFENILNHENISIKLNTEYRDIKEKINYKYLIYTGCIDEYFDYKFGKLPYRSLRFNHKNLNQEYYQNWSQINHPNDHKYTRIVEIKHATGQKCPNTTIVKEYPKSKGEPFYPIPNTKNHKLLKKYEIEAKKLKNTIFAGRLAEYKYFNMDQVIENTLDIFKYVIKR